VELATTAYESIFCSSCVVSCGGEIVCAFLRSKAAKGVGYGLPEVWDCSRRGGAQEDLEFGEGHFDGIEVGAVGRQVAQACAGGLDRLSHAMDLVSGQIDGVDAPSRHRCAKVVSLIIT
jgi:hypothetical protein